MTRRLLLSYLTVTLVVLLLLEVPLAIVYAARGRQRLTAEVDRDASVIATIYEDDLERAQPLDPQPALNYLARTGARVVVVDAAGVSRVDTAQSTPRDFASRPEIATALTGRRASGTRRSETLRTELLYVAVPVASGGVVHGAIRLTLDTGDVNSTIYRFWGGLVAVAVVVLAAMTLIGFAVARSLTQPLRSLQRTALKFSSGDLRVDPGDGPTGPPEIAQLAATMSTMAQRLAAILAEQQAFVADASHQLRTPLTALRLRLENLQSRLDAAEAAELETAIDETDRLGSLVNDLLQLARSERGEACVEEDLAQLAADRVDTWGAIAEASGVDLALRRPSGTVLAQAVPGAIEQILDNVLDNALAASPPGGGVTVSVEPGGETHRLAVVDHGPGLSDADKRQALRRFWRGDTTTAGTGLGLAIVDALAAASGATVDLTDTPGHGLTVTVTFQATPRLAGRARDLSNSVW